jgi:xylulose-5-phosphate/fructose-6-phosphate phosphoketolase
MMLCNHTSRYHVAAAAVRGGALHNPKVAVDGHSLASSIMHMAQKDHDYIFANGKGMWCV